MSYILEALSDSERTRQQLELAPRLSLLPVVGEESRPQRIWPYALAGALLVNAGVLQFWLRAPLPGGIASLKAPASLQAAEVPLATADAAPAPLARVTMPAARGAAPADAKPLQAEGADRAAVPAALPDAVPAAGTAISANGSAPIQLPKSVPGDKAKRSTEIVFAARPKPSAAAAVVNPAPIPQPPSAAAAAGTTEMSPALQREMPVLAVAGFIRGDGSNSMVIVNDILAREGDEVAPGVKLERIVGDTLEFNYKGYRFKR